jgi:hypothetical protein
VGKLVFKGFEARPRERVLVNSTKKGVSQLHKGNAESTSKQEYTEMSKETTESQE